jgi:hypothetical protein
MKNRIHRVAVAAVVLGGLALSVPLVAVAAAGSGVTAGAELGGVMHASADAAARQKKLLVSPPIAAESSPAPTLVLVSPALQSRSLTRAPEPPVVVADESGPAGPGTMILSALALMLWIAGRRINR